MIMCASKNVVYPTTNVPPWENNCRRWRLIISQYTHHYILVYTNIYIYIYGVRYIPIPTCPRLAAVGPPTRPVECSGLAQRFNSLVWFTGSIHRFGSPVRSTGSVHWFGSPVRCTVSVHWFGSLVQITS